MANWTDRLPDDLPAGRFVVPDSDFAPEHDGSPVMWIGDRSIDNPLARWDQLYLDRESTGLYPLVLPHDQGLDGRPWDDGELSPIAWRDVEASDPALVLAQRWEEVCEGIESWPGDSGLTWPGLIHRTAPRLSSTTWLDMSFMPDKFLNDARIGLVPARTGAEALAVCGWMGALNYYDGTPHLPTIIRSWEERFDFRLVALTFDEMVGTVAPGIKNTSDLAKEHHGACPDMIDQNFGGDPSSYVEYLDGNTAWYFWWD